MKLALAFSSKDRVHLSEQSMQRLAGRKMDRFWNDGSKTDAGKEFHQTNNRIEWKQRTRVTGGPDAAIVFALTQMLENLTYTHVAILENDVMLDHNWFNKCLELFRYSNSEGLNVGAVSARAYVDRVLIQRGDYAVLHNAGAGHLVLTRDAARCVLDNYRTGWWGENRAVFAQLSGIDIGKYGAFHGNEQHLSADWSYDTILAAHGFATIAPTPTQAAMIGQDVPLEQQGLALATQPVEERRDDNAFHRYRKSLNDIRDGKLKLPTVDWNTRTRNQVIVWPHHLPKLGAVFSGEWRTRWQQGTGPFAYQAGPGGACLTVPAFVTCTFQLAGTGSVRLRDELSGFNVAPPLPPDGQIINVFVPSGTAYRNVTLECSEGVVFLGIICEHDQPHDPTIRFDFGTLPPMWEQTPEPAPPQHPNELPDNNWLAPVTEK